MTNEETIDQAAARIRKYISDIRRYEKSAAAMRIMAGDALIAIRPHVEAAGHGWNEWCDANIDRSRSWIAKLMQLARADNPEVAAEADRENARQRQAEQRQRDKELRRERPNATDTETQRLLAISEDERGQALAAAQQKQAAMAEAFRTDQANEAQRLEREQQRLSELYSGADADDEKSDAGQEKQEATEQSVVAADAVRRSEAEAAVVQEASAQPGNAVAAMDKHGRLLSAGYPVLADKIFRALTVAEAHALCAILTASGRLPQSRHKLADALTTAINRPVQTAVKGGVEKAQAQPEPVAAWEFVDPSGKLAYLWPARAPGYTCCAVIDTVSGEASGTTRGVRDDFLPQGLRLSGFDLAAAGEGHPLLPDEWAEVSIFAKDIFEKEDNQPDETDQSEDAILARNAARTTKP